MKIVVTFEGFEDVVQAVKEAFSNGEFAGPTAIPDAAYTAPAVVPHENRPTPPATQYIPVPAEDVGVMQTPQNIGVGTIQVPPPPPVGIPSTTIPASAAIPANWGERDIRGMPWDIRIHARTKTKNADGSWRMKRGVADALVAQVTAEIMATSAAVATVAPVAAVQPAPPIAVAAVAPPQAIGATFENLMELSESKGLGFPEMNVICARHGVTSVVLLQQQPALIPPILAEIQGYGQ